MNFTPDTAAICSGPTLLRRQLAVACRILSQNGHDDFNQARCRPA